METVVKSSQEQAVAAWAGYLRQIRFDAMLEELYTQDTNLESALYSLKDAKVRIAEEIIGRNRGGPKGMHGYIAEVLEVSIGNARQFLVGTDGSHIWVNDNKATDIIRGDIGIQQKFVQTGKHWGLEAIREHLSKYPDYIKQGKKYQIPKDFYEYLVTLYQMPQEEAAKLIKSDDINPYSYTKWKWVQDYFEQIKQLDPEMSIDKIEPAFINYEDAKAGNYEKTLSREKQNLASTDGQIRDRITEHGAPNLQEATAVTVVGALAEGGMSFCIGFAKKRKEKKSLSNFTDNDWAELGIKTGSGTIKGAIRGASVYALSNFSATPENVASALVTAMFGVTAQANALRKGQISKEDFIINSETVCLDVTISAIASLLGQTLIPVPVLGAIIGNTAGMFMYEIAKTVGLEKEQKLISNYQAEMKALQADLDKQYEELLILLDTRMKQFKNLIELAFDPDVNKAFLGSVELAYYLGVPDNDILKTKNDIDIFFS